MKHQKERTSARARVVVRSGIAGDNSQSESSTGREEFHQDEFTSTHKGFLRVGFLVSFQGALAAKALPADRAGEAAHGMSPGHVGVQLPGTGKALVTFQAEIGFPRGVLLLLVSAELNQAGEREVAIGTGVLTGRRSRIRFSWRVFSFGRPSPFLDGCSTAVALLTFGVLLLVFDQLWLRFKALTTLLTAGPPAVPPSLPLGEDAGSDDEYATVQRSGRFHCNLYKPTASLDTPVFCGPLATKSSETHYLLNTLGNGLQHNFLYRQSCSWSSSTVALSPGLWL
ncbi:hypothetical protein EYF80_013515 [Liparis tanakae]|uniref:Uncharacterized protein n=1 Tax=Liparis tanakae TaxID=230148 RepID=A0A4Z2IE85_9TELE|nr:hypothetical protein EYF80_013515 [Liparis tanakae]